MLRLGELEHLLGLLLDECRELGSHDLQIAHGGLEGVEVRARAPEDLVDEEVEWHVLRTRLVGMHQGVEGRLCRATVKVRGRRVR